jgi:hypothetical protein
MSYSQADIDALKAAIAKGVTEVRVGEESIKFDSLPAMLARLRIMEREVAGVAAPALQTYPRFAVRPT